MDAIDAGLVFWRRCPFAGVERAGWRIAVFGFAVSRIIHRFMKFC